MDKIKKIDEFNNILEYFYYLKDALDDLNKKKNRAISSDSKKFYQEQIDFVLKHRSSIRDVVLAKKEQIIHEKLANIKDDQIKKFISFMKKEKERISHEKVNLELEIALISSISDLDKNFFAPIAKYANEYDCSDFFVTDENYHKSYLIKDNNNELKEIYAIDILSSYLGNDADLLDKINKRHNLKNSFMNRYIEELKAEYPNYSDAKIKLLAHDNLISHSPEFLEQLDKKYSFTTEEYEKLAKAYADFRIEYQYLKRENLSKKQAKLNDLTDEFNNISKIPAGKDLESYLLKKFEENEKKTQIIKTASEILENDSKIVKYINGNNLLSKIELSPDTKLDYAEQLATQNALLEEIKNIEKEMQNNDKNIQEYEAHLNTLAHSKSALGDIYTSENIINNVSDIVDKYNTNFVIPLTKMQEEYRNYKNSQELGLIPYQKPSFFEKISGFFNGRNKIQAEFNNKCQIYESQICVLTQKMHMHKPNYSFDSKHPLAKSIGEGIKEYLSSHPDANDVQACAEVLKTHRQSLTNDIAAFKGTYNNYIEGLDKCFSYNDISDCVLEEINKIQKQLDNTKENKKDINSRKNVLCYQYNENASRPISAISTLAYLENISTEFKLQLQKLSAYKGENMETLEYKAEIEKVLETDSSFISNEEIDQLGTSAHKKAELILNNAINDYSVPASVKNENASVNNENKKLKNSKLIREEIALEQIM